MIVATAGHVDHGKTSLVKQLTGVDTDRLEEEKRRGLSINLGYAYLPIILPDGRNATLGFIDVPGHSRFLNTMISGVSGIDLGLLVVAANDGPMPQTIEHIQVMGLLGVRRYAVAITHIDTVGADRIVAVSASVTSLLAAQGCREDVAVFPVNNLTGEGIPELADFLTLRAAQREVQDYSGLFRMSIDRAFLLKGSGLIVTGTAQSGAVGTEEHLLLLPQRKKLRVRSIHADDQATDRASGGQRCALNIVGDVEKSEINRGDWLVTPEAGPTTRRFDARLRLLGSASFGLKHLSPVTLYLGASRLKAKVSLLEEHGGRRKLGPGDDQLAQLLLEREVSCCHGDRFLLRDDSETHLLGGGVVIDPWGLRAGKGRPERLSQLLVLEEPEIASTLAQLIGEREEVIDLTRLAQARNLSISEARKILEKGNTSSQIFTWQHNDSQYCASMNHYRTVERRLLQHLADWHRDNPLDKGMPVKLGTRSLPSKQDAPLLLPATAGLVEKGEMKLVGGLLSLPGHRISMDSGDTKLWSRIEASLQKHGKILPPLGDLAKELKQDPQALLAALRRACAAEALHQVSDRRFALPKAMIEFAEAVNAVAERTGRFSVIEYRDHLAIGRNQAVELLEYFDRVKFTRRQGNERIVLDEEFPRQYRTATSEQE